MPIVRGMSRLVAVLAVFLALAGTAAARGQGDPPPPASTEAPAVKSIADDVDLELQVFVAVNAVRKERGLSALRLNRGLGEAARNHSRSMAEHGFFRHESYDGAAFWHRIKPMYKPMPRRYWRAGENMVWASPGLSAAQAIDMWMKSPPHRKIILTPNWRDIGIGGVHAAAAPGVYQGLGVTIVTADFGVR
jgi:uncharacterized protein YkwD